jgi:hypothetical protein
MDNRISPAAYKPPRTLDTLCDELSRKGGKCDYELRADSVYGPLRLKTEHALIGIRKRRVQHQQNARLYVWRHLRDTVDGLLKRDGIPSGDKALIADNLKGAWVEEGFNHEGPIRITQSMVLRLRDKVKARDLECIAYLENKKKGQANSKSVAPYAPPSHPLEKRYVTIHPRKGAGQVLELARSS